MNEIVNKIEEDIFLKDFIYKKYSKKFYGFLKSNNAIFIVNNNIVNINSNLKNEDIFVIQYENKEKNTLKINKEIDILYEDDYLIILDKPHNLLTIPSRNNQDSLYSRLLYHKGDSSLNVITRLDKLTAGIVLVVKKHYLVEEVNNSFLLKEYNAQTDNLLPCEEGIINLPILKSNTTKRVVNEHGKSAITHYKLLDKDKCIYSLVLKTGRTHQIRVHLSYYNCSIIGDDLYNGRSNDVLKLICSKIKLIHPITKEELVISSKYKI